MTSNINGKYSYQGEYNRCFISGSIARISEDRCTVYITRQNDDTVCCLYKKGKNKLPLTYNVGDYVLFNGKVMESKLISSNHHHVFFIFSAFQKDSKGTQSSRNNCEISGYIIGYKKIDDELVVAELRHGDKLIKLYFKRNYRFILYDFENKYQSLETTHIYVHGHFKLDGIWVDGIRECSKAMEYINSRINV